MLREELGDVGWSSSGLAPNEALRCWQSLACEVISPMEIHTPDPEGFAASWRSHALGPLRLVALKAGPLALAHPAHEPARPIASVQLVYCRRTPMVTQVDGRRFCIEAGQFALLDNSRTYEMQIEGPHQAVDLVIPGDLLERWLVDPSRHIARPISASTRWGFPLGSYLATLARDIGSAALPRAMLADQIGPLLALAVGEAAISPSRHKAGLVARALRLMRERMDEPELSSGDIAAGLGVSKRHLNNVLADVGETFTGALTRIRIDSARQLLADRRHDQDRIADIAWRCGYADPAYFSRVFSCRVGMAPRAWRAANRA